MICFRASNCYVIETFFSVNDIIYTLEDFESQKGSVWVPPTSLGVGQKSNRNRCLVSGRGLGEDYADLPTWFIRTFLGFCFLHIYVDTGWMISGVPWIMLYRLSVHPWNHNGINIYFS